MATHLKTYSLLFLILLCSGCNSRLAQQARQIDRDSQLACQEGPPCRCAIASHLQDLADTALYAETTTHYVGLLNIGRDALLTRIHLIRAARESIQLQTFIWTDDEVGQVIFAELLEAARRGVKVQLILDQVGTQASANTLARMAVAHENIDIQLFKPTLRKGGKSEMWQVGFLLTDFETLNKRMHNKLLVIDRRIGIVGGRNIAKAYYDYDPRFCFKDLDLLIIGPVVQNMTDSFAHYWDSKTTESALELSDIAAEAATLKPQDRANLITFDVSRLDSLRQMADGYAITEECTGLNLYPVSRVEYAADWPEKNKRSKRAQPWNSTQRLNEIFEQAQSEIVIQTPYLIQDKKGIKALRTLRKERPDLGISLSTNSLASSDKFFVHALYQKQRQLYLQMAGAKMYEFKPLPGDVLDMVPRYTELLVDTPDQLPGLIVHAKFLVVDRHICFVGSHNFDPRARNLNTENAVIIWDDAVAAAIRQVFDRDTAPQNSWAVARCPKPPVVGQASNFLAAVSSSLPFFDLWPFGYSSNYQLREGFAPVPSDHPDFYTHYRDVGVFPEMELSYKKLGAAFVKSFGGLFMDLL